MVRVVKKGKSGHAAQYLSRNQALKKFQLTLADFRWICILKGIFPKDPPKKRHLNKIGSPDKAFYHVKDLAHLNHEPLIKKLREYRAIVKKIKKAKSKNDVLAVESHECNQPSFSLDHIIKARYPTFNDAVNDLDDTLSTISLFARLPSQKNIPADMIENCKKLLVEFMHYVIATNALRKVFISFKGIYYQVEINGILVTWVSPHELVQEIPIDVDFRIMKTFVDLYSSMLGFINYKLFHSINVTYPLMIDKESVDYNNQTFDEYETEILATLNRKIRYSNQEDSMDIDFDPLLHKEEDLKNTVEMSKFKHLFKGLKFFLSREVPHQSLTFIIRSFDGEVSWDGTCNFGSTYNENDQSITHQIIDRPTIKNRIANRLYIQPQWVFDCINARELISFENYLPGAILPPHFSPFYNRNNERIDLRDSINSQIKSSLNENKIMATNKESINATKSLKAMKNTKNMKKKKTKQTKSIQILKDEEMKDKEKEEKKLAIMTMPKGKRKLYNKLIKAQKVESNRIKRLVERRVVNSIETN